MYGGLSSASTFKQIGVDDYVPDQQCQEEFEEALYPEFNPLKRCYWELKIPCDCRGNRELVERGIASPEVAPTPEVVRSRAMLVREVGRSSPHSEPLERKAGGTWRKVRFLDFFLRGAKVDAKPLLATQGSVQAADFAPAETKQNESSNSFTIRKLIRARMF